jgi:hypothetical protein
MQITTRNLAQYASNFLEVLDLHHIRRTEDLEKFIGRTLNITSKSDYLLIEKRPSNVGTQVYCLEYNLKPNGGTPIALRLNSRLGYGKLHIKCNELILGYQPFNWDSFHNLAQEKAFQSAEIALPRHAIEELSRLHTDHSGN